MKKNRRHFPVWPFLLATLVSLVLFRQQTNQAVTEGIQQCIYVIFPSLFPFFILVNLLLETEFPTLLSYKCKKIMARFFHADAGGTTAVVLSLLGGYPVGAKTAAELCQNGKISTTEAECLLSFCNNTGPAIFFGLAGSLLFNGLFIPLLLYFIHIFSAFLTGYTLRPKQWGMVDSKPMEVNTSKPKLTEAIWDSFGSTVKICAFVIAFRIVIELGEKILLMVFPVINQYPVVFAVFAGILDLPNGIAALTEIKSLPIQFLLCSVFINWGGLCIHLQTKAVVEPAKLSLKRHCIGKMVQTVFSIVLSIPVCAYLSGYYKFATISLFLFTAIFIILMGKEKTKVEIPQQNRYNSFKAG